MPQAALLRFDPGALESSGENEREDKNIYNIIQASGLRNDNRLL